MPAAVGKIIDAGIPVMGHLGLTPQSIYKFGTYSVRAKQEEEAERLMQDAIDLQEAGCFSIVFEKIPAELAARGELLVDDTHHRHRSWGRLRWPGAGPP